MTEPLHVITFHANPMGWESRRRLFLAFEDYITRQSGIDFSMVEVVYPGGVFEMGADLKLRAADLMWHKENALNALVKTLPSWNYLAWIDADLRFSRQDWVEATIQALQTHDVVQLFDEAVQLGPEGEPLSTPPYRGMVASYRRGESGPSRRPRHSPWRQDSLSDPLPPSPSLNGHPGFAWACTRSAWDRMGGLGDWDITGSADRHMAAAWLGSLPQVRHDMTPATTRLWDDWAARVKGFKIGYIPGTLYHGWHGSRHDRQYFQRHRILRRADPPYDPALDLETDPQSGLWRFTPHGERFRAPLREYFAGRLEDKKED